MEKKAFMDRMQAYAEEGIRHFYFMELQKDEVRNPFSSPAGELLPSLDPSVSI